VLGFHSTANRGNFELVVRNLHGGVQTLELSATDANAACALAARDGLQVLACSARGSLESMPTEHQTAARMGIDVANFAYELSSLMAAGLSVMEALRTLTAKEGHDQTRRALLDIVSGVNEGLPLSAALQRPPGRYPPLLIATVSASEQTGDLGTALRRYAEYQLLIKALRDKVVGATIYPLLLLTMGCLVVMFLMTVVVPKFSVLIASTRHALPWSSQLLISWGSFASQYAWQIRSGGLVLLVALLLMARNVLRSGAKATWLERIPFIGPTMRQFRHSQLYRTTGMLVRGGIAVPRALQLGATLLGDTDRERLGRAINLIHEGRSLSHALEYVQLADPVATSMLAVAERTGDLADMLERIAQFHESRLQRSVEITSRLMIVIGMVVAAIVVMMYLPIFDLASSLQ
jgi:general secretion pathway protein F